MRFLASRPAAAGDRVRLLGVPLGAAGGPAAVRRASQRLGSYVPRLGCDLADVPTGDLGDAADELGRPFEDGCRPVWIGGDGTVTELTAPLLAPLHPGAAVARFGGRLPTRLGEKLGDGTVWCLGARAYAPDERDYFRRHQRLLAAHEIDLEEAAAAAVEETRGRPLYVSVALDVLDLPGVFEGFGAARRELWAALKKLAAAQVVGLDVVEVVPEREPGLALVAAELVRDCILCWWSR